MVYYKRIENGKDEWVIFLHCICYDNTIFNLQIETFSKHFNILLIDLPGHGNSINYKDKFNVEDVIDDINKIIIDLNLKVVNIVGLSLGTIIASCFYLKYPKKVNKLILLSCAFGLKNDILNNIFYFFNKVNILIPRDIYLHLFIYFIIPEKRNKKYRIEMYNNAIGMRKEQLKSWFLVFEEFFKKFDHSINNKIKDSKIKRLYIMGDKDKMWLPKINKSISNDNSSELVILKNTSHLCNLENVEAFNNKLIKFLVNN